GTAAELDGALDGLLGQLAEEGELRGELGSARLVHVDGKLPSRRIAAAGLGEPERVDADAFRTAAAAVAAEASEFVQTIAWALDASLPVPLEQQASAVVEGTLLGGYDPARWKHDGPKPKLDRLVICGGSGLEQAVDRT